MRQLAIAVLALSLAGPVHAEELAPLDDVEPGSPVSAVARINVSGSSYCTGALIGRDLIVTAAHCLYNTRTGVWARADSIHVLLGYSHGIHGFHTTAASYQTGDFDPRRETETLAEDWALLRLEDEAPHDYAILRPQTEAIAPGSGFRITGYAAPRRYALSTSPDCMGNEKGGLLLSRCPSSGGMSGGPLIKLDSDKLVGIQVATMQGGNGEVMMVALPATRWAGRTDRP